MDIKLKASLKIIHILSVLGRKMAYENKDYIILANLFDDIEYLLVLLNETVNTNKFRNYLAKIEKKYHYYGLCDTFDKKILECIK